MRNAARRNERSKFSITFRAAGGGGKSAGPAAGPAVAANSMWPAKYSAYGTVKCSAGVEVRVAHADPTSPVKHRLPRFANRTFTANDGSNLPAERKEDHFIPDVAVLRGLTVPGTLTAGR
jgi:hypothetical protein